MQSGRQYGPQRCVANPHMLCLHAENIIKGKKEDAVAAEEVVEKEDSVSVVEEQNTVIVVEEAV